MIILSAPGKKSSPQKLTKSKKARLANVLIPAIWCLCSIVLPVYVKFHDFVSLNPSLTVSAGFMKIVRDGTLLSSALQYALHCYNCVFPSAAYSLVAVLYYQQFFCNVEGIIKPNRKGSVASSTLLGTAFYVVFLSSESMLDTLFEILVLLTSIICLVVLYLSLDFDDKDDAEGNGNIDEKAEIYSDEKIQAELIEHSSVASH